MDHAADAYHIDLTTINRFVLNEQSKRPKSRGDFTIFLSHIVLGCKFVCLAVNKTGLVKFIGLAGETNVQGEEQKKLDVLSNEVFVKALTRSGRTSILVSEEDEEATFVDPALHGKCMLLDLYRVMMREKCGKREPGGPVNSRGSMQMPPPHTSGKSQRSIVGVDRTLNLSGKIHFLMRSMNKASMSDSLSSWSKWQGPGPAGISECMMPLPAVIHCPDNACYSLLVQCLVRW